VNYPATSFNAGLGQVISQITGDPGLLIANNYNACSYQLAYTH
jgi:hypothetical protein